MKYTLPVLPYSYDALSPYIDAKTMEIHHTKHHQGYIDKLNAVLSMHPEMSNTPVEKMLSDLSKVPEDIRLAVQNQGGGHVNHSFFWQLMKKGGSQAKGLIADEIQKVFGTMNVFQQQFNKEAQNLFGSGWAWLCVDKNGTLKIVATKNQDSPISQGLTPILGLDVWEHAYYLSYQNRRPDYIAAWWRVVNWEMVEELYRACKKN